MYIEYTFDGPSWTPLESTKLEVRRWKNFPDYFEFRLKAETLFSQY